MNLVVQQFSAFFSAQPPTQSQTHVHRTTASRRVNVYARRQKWMKKRRRYINFFLPKDFEITLRINYLQEQILKDLVYTTR